MDRYDGDAANLWADADSGAELVKRVGALPGFGKQKSQIFTALLGKQFGVQPPGWREAAGRYGEEGSFRSVADIVDGASLAKVRAYKQGDEGGREGLTIAGAGLGCVAMDWAPARAQCRGWQGSIGEPAVKKQQVRPVLITDAARSQRDQLRSREIRYVMMMGHARRLPDPRRGADQHQIPAAGALAGALRGRAWCSCPGSRC